MCLSLPLAPNTATVLMVTVQPCAARQLGSFCGHGYCEPVFGILPTRHTLYSLLQQGSQDPEPASPSHSILQLMSQ